jgi:hypothetical protein
MRTGKTGDIRWSRVVVRNWHIAADVRSRSGRSFISGRHALFHPRETTNEVPIIGWIGTHTTYPFLERLMPLFDRLAREHRFALEIIGSGRPDIDTRPWSMNTEAEDIRSFDIGVYPLTDDEWNARKSGLKAVQYMASGVPFVMSPVGVCATIGGVTNTPWYDGRVARGAAPSADRRRAAQALGRMDAVRGHRRWRRADLRRHCLRVGRLYGVPGAPPSVTGRTRQSCDAVGKRRPLPPLVRVAVVQLLFAAVACLGLWRLCHHHENSQRHSGFGGGVCSACRVSSIMWQISRASF